MSFFWCTPSRRPNKMKESCTLPTSFLQRSINYLWIHKIEGVWSGSRRHEWIISNSKIHQGRKTLNWSHTRRNPTKLIILKLIWNDTHEEIDHLQINLNKILNFSLKLYLFQKIIRGKSNHFFKSRWGGGGVWTIPDSKEVEPHLVVNLNIINLYIIVVVWTWSIVIYYN